MIMALLRSARNPWEVQACARIPEVIADQVDVLPADRRKMGEQGIQDCLATTAQKILHEISL